MTTTDANGIIRWESTDPVTPLESTLNAGMDSVSAAVTLVKRGLINYVANTSARNALAASYAPSATKPLYVHRGDATTGFNLEYTTNGTTWRTVRQNDPELLSYQTSGTTTGVLPPTSAIPDVGANNRIIRKTGRIAFTTTTSFGNEYAPEVTFTTAFPTALLNVNFTQIHAGASLAYSGAMAMDIATRTSFRVLYAGTSAPTARAFLWEATGF